MRRVALATCADLPDGDEDFRPLIAALAAERDRRRAGGLGRPGRRLVRASTSSFRGRPGTTPSGATTFLAWAAALPRVLNPLECSTGTPTSSVPDRPRGRRGADRPDGVRRARGRLEPPEGPFVVKPAISAGGRSSARFEAGGRRRPSAHSPDPRRGPHGDGQPYLGEHEEKALVYIDGAYSHAVRRQVPLPARANATSSTWTRSSARPRRPRERRRRGRARLRSRPLLNGRST